MSKKPGLYHAGFLVIAIIFIGTSIKFKFGSHYINGGDTFQPLNFQLLIERSLSIWESSASGAIGYLKLEGLIPGLILKFLLLIFRQPILAINIFWIILIYYLQLAYFVLFRLFVNRQLAFIGVILGLFNLFFLIFFHTPLTFQVIGLAAFPMLFYAFTRFMQTSQKKYLLLYAVVHFVSFRSLNIIVLADGFIPLLSYLLFRKTFPYTSWARFIKKTIMVLTLSVLICLPYFMNLYFFFSGGLLSNAAVVIYNQDALSINTLFGLKNILRLSPNYGFLNRLSEEPGWVAQGFSSGYLSNAVLIFNSYLLIVLTFMAAVKMKASDKRDGIVLISFIAIFLFLAKGINPPFAFLNQYLYSNQIFATMFRSGALYFMYFLVPLIILLIIKSRSKIILAGGMVYAIVNIFVVFVLYSPLHKYWNSTLPSGYSQFTKELNNYSGSNKFLVVPIPNHFIGYTVYNDGYGGPDRLYTLTDKTLLTKIQATQISKDYSNTLKEIETNPPLINVYANKLGYQYVIAEKDAIASLRYTTDSYKTYTDVLDPSKWHKVFENEIFILYQLDPRHSTGRIYADNADVEFSQISPTQYKIKITGLKDTAKLQLLESYHKGWKLYQQPTSTTANCQAAVRYTRSVECQATVTSADKIHIGSLTQESVFEDSHRRTEDYHNNWNISASYIKQNFAPSYYSENPDGSVNLNLSLSFQPQAYNQLGMFISATAITTLGGWVAYDSLKYRSAKKRGDHA